MVRNEALARNFVLTIAREREIIGGRIGQANKNIEAAGKKGTPEAAMEIAYWSRMARVLEGLLKEHAPLNDVNEAHLNFAASTVKHWRLMPDEWNPAIARTPLMQLDEGPLK